MNRNLVKKILSPIPAILLFLMIYSFSEQTGEESGTLSRKISLVITGVLNRVFGWGLVPEGEMNFAAAIEIYVRKTGHFVEFMMLAAALFWPVSELFTKDRRLISSDNSMFAMARTGTMSYSETRTQMIPFFGRIGLAFGIAVVAASLDEFHQTGVDGRFGCLTDVLIDSSGAAFGLLMIFLVKRLIDSAKKKKGRERKTGSR